MRQTRGMADTSFDPDTWDYEKVHCSCVRYHCISSPASAGQWEMKPLVTAFVLIFPYCTMLIAPLVPSAPLLHSKHAKIWEFFLSTHQTFFFSSMHLEENLRKALEAETERKSHLDFASACVINCRVALLQCVLQRIYKTDSYSAHTEALSFAITQKDWAASVQQLPAS